MMNVSNLGFRDERFARTSSVSKFSRPKLITPPISRHIDVDDLAVPVKRAISFGRANKSDRNLSAGVSGQNYKHSTTPGGTDFPSFTFSRPNSISRSSIKEENYSHNQTNIEEGSSDGFPFYNYGYNDSNRFQSMRGTTPAFGRSYKPRDYTVNAIVNNSINNNVEPRYSFNQDKIRIKRVESNHSRLIRPTLPYSVIKPLRQRRSHDELEVDQALGDISKKKDEPPRTIRHKQSIIIDDAQNKGSANNSNKLNFSFKFPGTEEIKMKNDIFTASKDNSPTNDKLVDVYALEMDYVSIKNAIDMLEKKLNGHIVPNIVDSDHVQPNIIQTPYKTSKIKDEIMGIRALQNIKIHSNNRRSTNNLINSPYLSMFLASVFTVLLLLMYVFMDFTILKFTN